MFIIFRLITSRRFYAGIICSTFFVMRVSQIEVSSFRWTPAISVSTSLHVADKKFIPNSKIKEKIIALTYMNISLGNEWSASFNTDIGSPDGDDVSKALFYTKSLTNIVKTDIVSIIARSEDKSTIMQTFLSQWETTIRQATLIENNLQSIITRQTNALLSCQTSKSSADSLYVQWLSTDNASQVATATTQATQANECLGKQNTIINSAKWVLDRLNKINTKANIYITLIRNNKNTILQYPDLIDSNTPANILEFQKSLNTMRGL